MVNIIPENRRPSTAEKFGRAFAGAGQSLAESIPNMMMQREQQKASQMRAMQEMALEYALKGQHEETSSGREFERKRQLAQEEFERQMQRDEQKSMSDFNRQQSLQHQKHALESGGKAEGMPEVDQAKNTAQQAYNGMIKILKSGKIGRGSKLSASIFGGQTAKDVGEFTSLSGALESLLVDQVSKGSLTNERFKYITETLLPKANDSDATIEGKLIGLGKMLGLDMSELTGKSSSSPIVMRDKKGNVYDIPPELREQARAQGLIE